MIIMVQMEPIESCDYCGNFNPKGERCECEPMDEDFSDFNEACERFLKKS